MNPETSPAEQTWREALLGLFYPPACQICGQHRASAEEGFVCPGCFFGPGGVRFIVPPYCGRCGLPFEGDITGAFECGNCAEMHLQFRFARSAVTSSPLVLEVIHRYKYQRALWFEPFLAGLLIRQALPVLRQETWDYLVPVPLHPVKERQREFNQAVQLARRLEVASGIPVHAGLLERIEPTQTQTKLSRSERTRNVQKAFALKAKAPPLEKKRLLLLDDVLTTGSTISACAGVLRAAGAADVGVWTVARGVLN